MSFEELVKRISPTLKRITYKLNGHFSFFNEEDLYQEALMHLWIDFKDGKLSDKTDSYILQGCYFHLKNYLRKAKVKTKLVSLETLVNNKEESGWEENLLLPNLERQDYFDYLDGKLLVETICNNGITPREKEVLFLYADGLTTREIGKRLGISHARVVKLIGRVKDKCQRPFLGTGPFGTSPF